MTIFLSRYSKQINILTQDLNENTETQIRSLAIFILLEKPVRNEN
jgi:hypothetical protein